MKSDIPLLRPGVYLCLSRIINIFGFPENTEIAVYGRMLRCYQNEQRKEFVEAINILIPCLAQQTPQTQESPFQLPPWLSWTRTRLLEDSHNLSKIWSLWRLILHHSQYFLPYASVFSQPLLVAAQKSHDVSVLTSQFDILDLLKDLLSLLIKWRNTSKDSSPQYAQVLDPLSQKMFQICISPLFSLASLKERASFQSFLSNLVSLFHSLSSPEHTFGESCLDVVCGAPTKESQDLIDHFLVATQFLSSLSDNPFRLHQQFIERFFRLFLRIVELKNLMAISKAVNFLTSISSPLPQTQELCYSTFLPILDHSFSDFNDLPSAISFLSILQKISQNTETLFGSRNLLDFAILFINRSLELVSRLSLFEDQIVRDLLDEVITPNVNRLLNLGCSTPKALEICSRSLIFILPSRSLRSLVSLASIVVKDQQIDKNTRLRIVNSFAQQISPVSSDEDKRSVCALVVSFLHHEHSTLSPFSLETPSLEALFHGVRLKVDGARNLLLIDFQTSVCSRLIFQNDSSFQIRQILGRWVPYALELTLDAFDVDITFTPSSEAFFLQLPSSDSKKNSSGEECWKATVGFIHFCRGIQQSFFIRCLNDLADLSDELARSMWLALFPLLFDRCIKEREFVLSFLNSCLLPSMASEKLAAQEHCEVLDLILQGICSAHCNAFINPSLISEMAVPRGSWHAVLALLERNIELDSSGATRNCFIDLCFRFNEDDVAVGSLLHSDRTTSLKSAIVLQQFRLWYRARDILVQSLSQLNNQIADCVTLEQTFPIREELEQIEKQWIRCSKFMNSWECQHDISSKIDDHLLFLESCLHLGKYDELEPVLSKFQLNSSDLDLKLDVTLAKSYCSLTSCIEQRQPFDSNQLNPLYSSIIEKWSSLPGFVSESHFHLLNRMQETVEIHEVSGLFNESLKYLKENRNPNFSKLISTWRERLPCAWDDLPFWTSLFAWRHKVFQIISELFPSQATSTRYGEIQDIPWTMTKLASVSRKHLLPSASWWALEKLTYLEILDSNDAFYQLKEMVKSVLQLSTDTQLGLLMIQNTNLDYFSNQQKAQLFSMKAEALLQLGFGDECHVAFSASLTLDETDGKAWTSWGSFCDRVFGLNKDIQWASYAVACYLQAIAYNYDKARLMMTRVLWLLSYDTAPTFDVTKTFQKHAESLPSWTWYLWIPQLLSSLGRPEGSIVCQILSNLAKLSPQSLYYSIRAYMLDKRENFAFYQREVSRTPAQTQTDQPISLQHSENLFRILQQSHPTLYADIERILEEIPKRLRPDPEEELLGALNTIFIRCFRQPVSSPDNVPSNLIQTIEKIYSKFFTETTSSSQNHKMFLQEYRAKFEEDFLPTSSKFPAHLTELMRRLKKWKNWLQIRVGDESRTHLKLEKYSGYLAHYQASEVEIPGQYFSDNEPISKDYILLENFEEEIFVHRAHGFAPRRIGMRGSDGKVYHFYIQYSLYQVMRSEIRMVQMHVVLDRLLSKYNETRRRNLLYPVRHTIPFTNRLRLVGTKPCDISLEEIYVNSCWKHSIDADAPLTMYRNFIGSVVSWEKNDGARLEIFHKISKRVVPDSILTKYFQSSMSSVEHLWHFKKQFSKQMSISSFLCFILRVGDRYPHKLIFSRSTGEITQSEFHPSYNNQGMIENQEAVPFRLTPNLTRFMGTHFLHGVFGTGLLSVGACLLRSQDVLKNFMYLFFRDDLILFSTGPILDDQLRVLESEGREKVSKNTLEVLTKIQSIMPSVSDDSVRHLLLCESDCLQEILNHRVSRTINAACSESSLALMSPVWHPWL
jgi:transformation/transcription domain-associated protein